MKILFLCVANSARSQMAEGLARSLFLKSVEVLSAGSEATSLNPFATLAMKNIGVDISGHTSKKIEDVLAENIDLVITLCAEEVCPVVHGNIVKEHWPFRDPAAAHGTDLEILKSFENIRDQIREKLIAFGRREQILKEKQQ